MSLGFPLSVRSRFFFSVSEGGKGLCFCCVFCPLSREGNSGLPHIAHRPIIQIFTVVLMTTPPLSPPAQRPSAKQIHPLSHYAIFIHIKKY